MQEHEGICGPGDVLTLRLLDGIDREELLEMLRAEGIEIEVVEAGQGVATLLIRAPRRLMVLEEKGG